MTCTACGAEVLDIDVRCGACGAAIGASGAHRMIGQVMLGQYELVDVLGQGGMSVVFKGKHKLTDQEVALKILPPELAAHKEMKGRFLDEAKALAALDHPNIVHLYNFGQENGFFVLAMQLVQGQTWERQILETTRLGWVASCRIAIDVLRALEYAHGRGVVHRDMKPSNVLVRASDGAATVMDFGIAKMTKNTRLTATGQTMGTVRYMSPEQVRGQEVDLRTDIYSLGATLYESLVGDTPFDGETHFEIMTKHLAELPKRPSAHGIEVPLAIEDALMRSLAKRPDDRFSNAREMRKILEQVVRTADVGLGETQRVDRDSLPPVRAAIATPTVVREALADALEPGSSLPGIRRARRWPYVVVPLMLVAAGVGAAVVLGRSRGSQAPTAAVVPGVALPQHAAFGPLQVYTDGLATPEQVHTMYATALADVRAHFAASKHPLQVPERVGEIIAMPQEAFCLPAAYLQGKVPSDCATAAAEITISDANATRMYVVSDPARVENAVRAGVSQAVCLFEANVDSTLCDEADAVLGSH